MTLHTLAIIFAPGCIFLAAWVALGLQTQRHHHTPRNHGEGDGVGELGVGRLHNDRSQ